MTPDKQRIAIAKACGWKLTQPPVKIPIGTEMGVLDLHKKERKFWHAGFLPDYLNDLNDMHDAEKAPGVIVGPAEWSKYCDQIRIKIGRDIELRCGPGSVVGFMCLEAAVGATAVQRAEAFLRTLNLWTES